MPNPYAVVGLISNIDPPVSRSTTELIREFPNGFLVELEGQPSTRLYSSERAAVMLEILEGLRQLRTPVYLELDPDTRGINLLLIPFTAASITETDRTQDGPSVSFSRLTAMCAYDSFFRSIRPVRPRVASAGQRGCSEATAPGR